MAVFRESDINDIEDTNDWDTNEMKESDINEIHNVWVLLDEYKASKKDCSGRIVYSL